MTKQGSNRNSRGHYDKIFALFDDERTGYISIKNLRRVALELGEDISEEELNGMILRADLDNDELVGHEEFYTIMTRPIRR